MRRLPLLFLLLLSSPVFAQKTAAEWWKSAQDLLKSGDRAGSYRALYQAIDLAVQEHDVETESGARFYAGIGLSRDAKYDASDAQLRKAIPLFETLGNRRRVGEIYTYLGQNAYFSGRQDEARGNYETALATFEAIQDWSAVAKVHHSLTFFTTGADFSRHMEQAIEIARKAGDRETQARVLHSWGDIAYGTDDFDVAFDRLSQARSIFESLSDRSQLARVLTSIGRLYRVHGYPDQAFLYYQRARDLHKEDRDTQGVIQSLDAMGVALNNQGRTSEALQYDQEALQLARDSGSPLLIKFALEGVAACHLHLGQFEQAAALLQEARRMTPPRPSTLVLLSQAYFYLGQYEPARQTADEALTSIDSSELKRNALENRAQALWKLGRTEEALQDVRRLMQAVEDARSKLVPTDFMKQGFSNTDRAATSLSIQILLDNAQDREALETAERARGRAFLDLLATKHISRTRPSTASAETAVALARRLNSTIVAYWLDDHSTVVWTVSPEGRITHVRTPTGAEAIERWIDEALRTPGSRTPAPHVQIASRSGETILTGAATRAPWRKLYDALIRPVRSSLPSKPGSRLIIVPSGPLFRLSFAALMDERNRYLIETYALNYSPAIDVFDYTLQARQRAAALPARYLLVANPSGMPSAAGRALPALPGSGKEARGVARLLPPGSSTLLEGRQADEVSVRKAMPASRFIHLATHGIIDPNDPLASFLALGRTATEPAANGRLTAEEVSSLDLRADLVVLSACRTGLGRISGDGVAGLARAFLYAGAASVVSTLWDVADQPTAQLIEHFYRSLNTAPRHSKSEALRNAQLHLLRALRNGQVSVETPLGPLTLPEAPIFWAGYILLGEPQ